MSGEPGDLFNEACLSFLKRDIAAHPDRVGRLSETRIAEAVSLTLAVSADEEVELADDVTL